ncbi:PP2C family protein-serine/threonine phosphatase [Granulicoccus phenolivorans]|uniref:PP2C family protein-serine/threonine phosphatase n=1 Tax=Granulicoccus phenolivorans TaxID=266854 RepID=UPI0003F8606D|nr:protein phosphatase 2C domain-containing protein [Granulicoccus phenolivorans]
MTDRLHLRYLTHSEIGLVRKNNQDSGYASPRMLVVADGMGGAAAGDLASAVAIAQAQKADQDARRITGEDMLALLAGAVDRANEKIADLVADDPTLDGMGTTFSGAMFDGSQLGIVHIGDSRIYLLRDGELTRLTHDHSWVQSLVDEGKLTPEEAAYHPHRSLLLRVLNGQPASDPDTDLVDLQAGDRLLLCSDGLCGLVEDDDLRDMLTEADPDTVLADLIAAAHEAGGIDNITILLADVYTDETPAAAAPTDAAAEPETGAEADATAATAAEDDDAEKTVRRTAIAPVVIGAAQTREIPDIPPRHDLPERQSPAEDADEDEAEPTIPLEKGDEEELRYAPQLAPRLQFRRLLRWVVVGIVVIAVVVGVLAGGWSWSRTQYFVGAHQGQVTIFRGLHQQVAGVSLSEVYRIEQIQVNDLPAYSRERVRNSIDTATLDGAERTVNELRLLADDCRQRRAAQQQRSLDPTPSAAPAPQPPVDPNATPTPVDPNATPTPVEPNATATPPITAAPPITATPATAAPTGAPTPTPEVC